MVWSKNRGRFRAKTVKIHDIKIFGPRIFLTVRHVSMMAVRIAITEVFRCGDIRTENGPSRPLFRWFSEFWFSTIGSVIGSFFEKTGEVGFSGHLKHAL